MFDNILGELRRLVRGIEISVDLKLDGDGYLDRVCPSQDCQFQFKILFDDWRDKVRTEVVYCPICRFEAPADNWNSPEQQQYIEHVGQQYIQQRLDRSLSLDARQFNSSQPRGGLIEMEMSYSPGHLPMLVTPTVNEIMRQKSACEECDCRYSSLGAAFFLPGLRP